MPQASDIALLPDAGPLITLAYADALDALLLPGWQVRVVDMVQHEVTRNQTPTSKKLAKWLNRKSVQIVSTLTFGLHAQTASESARKANLGELAIQEAINQMALARPPQRAVLLFEDHRIASANFYVPDDCLKVSTRAFLAFLQDKGWIDSASDIERRAVLAGRQFSQLRFPPEVEHSPVLDPINAMRGSGAGGGSKRLIAERKAEAKRGK